MGNVSPIGPDPTESGGSVSPNLTHRSLLALKERGRSGPVGNVSPIDPTRLSRVSNVSPIDPTRLSRVGRSVLTYRSLLALKERGRSGPVGNVSPIGRPGWVGH